MAKVVATWNDYFSLVIPTAIQFAAPKGLTLAGSAQPEPESLPVMSGGAVPAGAAKHPEARDTWR